MMKLKDEYSKEELKSTVERVRDLFESEAGFIFIYTEEDKKITDLYHNISADQVVKIITSSMKDAIKKNLLEARKKRGVN